MNPSVADPDLQMGGGRGEGGGHADPEIRRGASLKKNFSRPFGRQFGPKIRGLPAPLGPSPGSTTALGFS